MAAVMTTAAAIAVACSQGAEPDDAVDQRSGIAGIANHPGGVTDDAIDGIAQAATQSAAGEPTDAVLRATAQNVADRTGHAADQTAAAGTSSQRGSGREGHRGACNQDE